jgi:hypothetical protein
LNRADIEESFRELSGRQHFYAEALRGRLRSLQLRGPEAEEHFITARRWAAEAQDTTPNTLRKFLLYVYDFDNKLLLAETSAMKSAGNDSEPLVLPDALVREHPELKYAIDMSRTVEGLLCLHCGQHGQAAKIFSDLIRSHRPGKNDPLAMYYIGLAAAQFNLGRVDSAGFNLENAGLCVQMGDATLNRARAAGILYGFYTYLTEKDEAENWRVFLKQLSCPEETKLVFLRRGELLVERCSQRLRLVLL